MKESEKILGMHKGDITKRDISQGGKGMTRATTRKEGGKDITNCPYFIILQKNWV